MIASRFRICRAEKVIVSIMATLLVGKTFDSFLLYILVSIVLLINYNFIVRSESRW